MDNLVKINNIATAWMEGHYNGEDLPADPTKAAFAAMHDIYDLSKDANWTPCSVALPEKDGAYDVTFVLDDGRRRITTVIFIAKTKAWVDALLKIIAWKAQQEPYRGEA